MAALNVSYREYEMKFMAGESAEKQQNASFQRFFIVHIYKTISSTDTVQPVPENFA